MKHKLNLYFYDLLFKPTPMHNQNGFNSQKKKISIAKYLLKKITNISKAIFYIFRCLFLEKNTILFFNHSQRTRKNSDFSRSPLYLNEHIFKKNIFHFIDNNATKIPNYNGPESILNISNINELFSILTIPSRIINKFKKKPLSAHELNFVLQSKYWSIILKILKPKKILFVVWYAYQPVIAAAKNIGIPTVDLQHGAIHDGHNFYYIKNIAPIILKNSTLPDECWVYGKYWKQKLINAGWNEDNVKVFGYYLNINLTNEENHSPYILYTTSISANKSEILNHINSIIDKVKKCNLKIIISPHPHENSNDYADILSDTVMLSNKDSYKLLEDCQIHISAFSTLLWEGLYFKKPTYILAFDQYKNYYPYLDDLIKYNLAKPIIDGQFPFSFNLEDNVRVQDYFSSVINTELIFS